MLNVRLIISSAIIALCGCLGTSTDTATAQVIVLDTSRVAPQFAPFFENAQAFWNARILGYSSKIPNQVRAEMSGNLQIFAASADLAPPTLGRAGPTTILSVVRGNNRFSGQPVMIPSVAAMEFSNVFFASGQDDEITDVIIHEMGHALGFGSLWMENGLLQPVAGGRLEYVGINARTAFMQELSAAGIVDTPFVPFVPVEQGGPGFDPGFRMGTSLGHWSDTNPFFNMQTTSDRVELLTGFLIPNTERFVSQTTLGSMVDLNYVVVGFNEDELLDFSGSGGFTKGRLPVTTFEDPFAGGGPFGPITSANGRPSANARPSANVNNAPNRRRVGGKGNRFGR